MEGIILLYNSWVRILFDLGVTHSFIRTTYAIDLGLNFEKLEHALNVDLPRENNWVLARFARVACFVLVSMN